MRLTSDIYLEDLFGLDSVFTFRGPVSGSFLMRLYLEGVEEERSGSHAEQSRYLSEGRPNQPHLLAMVPAEM